MLKIFQHSFTSCKSAGLAALPHKFQDAVNPDRVRRFVASDDTLDRAAEVVLPSGVSFANFSRAPRLMAFHDYQRWPIGKALAGGVVDGKVLLDLEFDPADIDPEADTVLRKIDHGTINTGSIGFIPGKWVDPSDKKSKELFQKYPGAQRIFTEWELLEYSIVPIPCNPNALAAAFEERAVALRNHFGLRSPDAAADCTARSAALNHAQEAANAVLKNLTKG